MTTPDPALRRAANALWDATLLLMTAYMHTAAPAHRYLLARRIATNFATLRAQDDCFAAASVQSFDRLASRWSRTAAALAPDAPAPGSSLSALWARLRLR